MSGCPISRVLCEKWGFSVFDEKRPKDGRRKVRRFQRRVRPDDGSRGQECPRYTTCPNTSSMIFSRSARVNGFSSSRMPVPSPWFATSSPVYPDMYTTFILG